MKPELEAKNRMAWHQESCSRLIAESSKERPADLDSVWRLKGSHLLARPGLAVLRELWHWRQAEAVGSNKPPYFVLSHETLVEIASASASSKPIEPFLPRHFSERRRAGLMAAIALGLGVSPEAHPKILRNISRRPSEAERLR